jgi:3-deoxy-7-phosphoheptulonate synthase
MLIVMKPDATEEQVAAVVRVVEVLGYRPHPMPGAQRTAIGVTGNSVPVDATPFEGLAGVAEAIRVTKPYKLVSLDLKPERTVVNVGDVRVGGGDLTIIAGPCAVETREQTFAVAEAAVQAGVKLFRGGAYKPRTSPYSFQGLGVEGLKILAEVRERYGLKIVTETIDPENLEIVAEYADVLQIGARNMQNFTLLKAAGRSRKPVLLKRGMSATLDELLLAAEYIMAEGNYNVILCERGVRTFADHTRNTLDVSIVPAVQRLSHLPILVDPSHAAGKRHKVVPLARAGVAVGADGVIVEVHPHPERALSDGPQALLPSTFLEMVDELRSIHAIVHQRDAALVG